MDYINVVIYPTELSITAVDTYIGLKNVTIYLYNSTEDLINSTNSSISPLQINFTGLAFNTYFMNATAYDNLNNSASTETIVVVLSAVLDTTAPDTITSLSSNVVNSTAIDWQWTNPVDVDFYSAILYLDGVNIINTTNDYYNATGLSCNTSYNLTIHTKDYTGNVNTTDVTNITTTSACPDTTPPASVTSLSSDVASGTAINWQWTNPADADFNSTILYLNGVNIADTAHNYYNATELTCNTQYNLTIHTRDNLWNINNTGVTDITTTSTCPGTTLTLTSSSGGGSCTSVWSCTDWGRCVSGTQTRKCTDTRCGRRYEKPIEIQNCTCIEDWICDSWTECSSEGKQTRNCEDYKQCGTTSFKPVTQELCSYNLLNDTDILERGSLEGDSHPESQQQDSKTETTKNLVIYISLIVIALAIVTLFILKYKKKK